MAKTPKNTITCNITVNSKNDFTVEPLKTSFAWLRVICYRFAAYVLDISVRYNMYLIFHVFYFFVLFLIYRAKYLRHYLSKTNGYAVLKSNCNPLYMRIITCGYSFIVTKTPVSVNLPTYGSQPQCQNAMYAPEGSTHNKFIIAFIIKCLIYYIRYCLY